MFEQFELVRHGDGRKFRTVVFCAQCGWIWSDVHRLHCANCGGVGGELLWTAREIIARTARFN